MFSGLLDPHPDPLVTTHKYGSGSGSGSFRHQKRALKMVSGLKGTTYEEKLKELGLTSLEERRHQIDMTQTFKIIHGIDQHMV